METRNLNATSEYVATTSTNTLPYISAVSWAAVFAGATAAASLSLILLVLGVGLGFSAISPWAQDGISGTTFGVSTILWITLTSLVASGIGGYISGRLRTRWVSVNSDEVHFRDTAHGFLSWGIATLATASLLTSVISAIASGAAQTGAALAGTATAAGAVATAGAAKAVDNSNMNLDEMKNYYMDALFRKVASDTNAQAVAPAATTTPAPATGKSTPASTPTTATTDTPPTGSAAAKAEVARIYANALATGNLPAEDARYIARTISQDTGLTQAEAETRVRGTFNTLQTKLRDAETAARMAAEKARKATAYGSLWLFVSLLIGAFVASLAAVFGGRQRDY